MAAVDDDEQIHLRSQSRAPQQDAGSISKCDHPTMEGFVCADFIEGSLPYLCNQNENALFHSGDTVASFFIEKAKTICYTEFRQQVKTRFDL